MILIHIADEPGKPGRPEPKDWDKDFVELQWTPPKDDGGAPIEKYVIQMRDKEGRNWVDAATVPGNKTTGRVENGIEPGHEYEFRVVAVNKAGPSEPSEASKSVIAKPRFCKSHPFDHSFYWPKGVSHHQWVSRSLVRF